jgi:hypothetical protein
MNYNDRINQQFGRIYRIHGNRMKNVRISQNWFCLSAGKRNGLSCLEMHTQK